MGPASSRTPSDPAASSRTEPPSPSERSQAPRRNDSRVLERRIPNARETLATLPDISESEFDFEPHDTIPAPPWLEELDEKTSTPHESP